MSDLIPTGPGKVERKRQKNTAQPIGFTAPTAAADPQTELDTQVTEIESSKKLLGLNVAITMNAASQRGFMSGLTEGLKEGAISEASFFSQCIREASASLR